MQFYIQQSTDPDVLFAIMDSSGQPVYRVTGDSLSIGSKLCMLDDGNREVARISCAGLTAISRYTISVGDKERARVSWNFSAKRQQVKIKGVNWQFRGDLVSRSYDIVDIDSAVVMSHGRCWNQIGDCYAADIAKESDVPVCLCLAVILDSTVFGGTVAAVPAN
jgi:Uncharacterized conserved protein